MKFDIYGLLANKAMPYINRDKESTRLLDHKFFERPLQQMRKREETESPNVLIKKILFLKETLTVTKYWNTSGFRKKCVHIVLA
jgi:hypothetical protein